MLKEEIERRNIPPVIPDSVLSNDWEITRRKLVGLFAQYVYGVSPPAPKSVASKVQNEDKASFAGKATHRRVSLSFETPKGMFSFPVDTIVPNVSHRSPMFIFLSFHTYKQSYETPIEETLDSGYALAILHYEAVTEDNDNMKSRLAGLFARGNDKDAWGKIGVWAYALSRVMDYIQTLDYIDKDRIACAGHSRLGKTSLWCGAQDTRFKAVFANNSGCSGAAITREKMGETVNDIYTKSFLAPQFLCSKDPRIQQ